MSEVVDRQRKFVRDYVAAHGQVKRRHVCDAFGVSISWASVIFRDFLKTFPDAIRYDKHRRAYVPGPRFDA